MSSILKLSRMYKMLRKFSNKCSPKPFHEIPGPRSLPLIGTLWQYLPLIGKYRFDRLHWNGFRKLEQYGPLVREEIIPGLHLVWVFKPKDIETVYRCEGRYPERRSHLALEKYRLDRPHMYKSGGLLPTNGPEWWRIRRIIQKDLNKIQNVRLYLSTTDQVIKHFLDTRVVKYKNDFLPQLSRLYLELSCLINFDECLGCFEDEEMKSDSKTSKLLEATVTLNSGILKTDNGPMFWKKFNTPLYKKMCNAHHYAETVAMEFINKKKSQLKDQRQNHQASLLELYLSNPELDFKDIIGTATDLLLAGSDAMTYSSCFALYLLSKNIPQQEAMFEELDALMTTDSVITEDILNQAIYTKAVIKEVFRMYPISVGVGRILAEDAILSGYFVPAKTMIVTQNQISCRLPQYFSNPNNFIPERWIRGHSLHKNVHPYLVLPFGHGPRACIARRLAEQDFQLFLMNVIRRYKLSWKGEDLDCKSLQINKPDKKVRIQFEKRER